MGDETMMLGAEGLGLSVVRNGDVFALGGGVFEEGEKGGAVEAVRFFKAAEVTEGGEEVDGFYDLLCACSGIFHLRIYDDERRAEGFFVESVLAPDGVLAEVPAVVSPEDDGGILGEAEIVELLDDSSDLGIGVADAGGVVLADFSCEFGILIGVFSPAVIFHELTGAMPGSFAFGFFWVRDGGKLCVFVEVEIFLWRAEGEVGAEDAGGEEEGVLCFGEELELVESFIDSGAIGVDLIASFKCLVDVHFFSILADFAMGEAVHPAAWVEPFPRG